MTIPRDFLELFESLNARKARFLVVGGYALAYHGAPRFTGDCDVLLATDRDNAEAVVEALNDFGFSSVGIIADDLQTPNNVIQLGYPPLRVDLLTGIDGVKWSEAYNAREVMMIDGVEVPFIAKSHLVDNKRASGRPRDIADLESLGETP